VCVRMCLFVYSHVCVCVYVCVCDSLYAHWFMFCSVGVMVDKGR
jgi:hypothetical protein